MVKLLEILLATSSYKHNVCIASLRADFRCVMNIAGARLPSVVSGIIVGAILGFVVVMTLMTTLILAFAFKK